MANIINIGNKTIKGVLAPVVVEIKSSMIWTVPQNIYNVDLYLVGAGYNGTAGKSDQNESVSGGAGGAGGKIIYVTNYPVTPGDAITITIGRYNGEDTIFGDLSTASSQPITMGGDGGCGDDSSITPKDGVYQIIKNNVGTLCFLNGKVYGASGAGGGGHNRYASRAKGGNCGTYTGGTPVEFNSSRQFGGGGASGSANGGNAASNRGGNGANGSPNTGNGGGGGGGNASASSAGSPGTGGTGGSGICIIRYTP